MSADVQASPLITLFIIAGLIGGGMALGLQAPTNAMVAKPMGSPIGGALVSFAIGALVLAAAALILRVRPDWSAMADLPWYAWLGGVYGAFFVAMATFAAPRIGVGPTVAVLIAGQAAMALLLDHIGAFGLARHPISLTRAAGMAAVVAGVVLVRRG